MCTVHLNHVMYINTSTLPPCGLRQDCFLGFFPLPNLIIKPYFKILITAWSLLSDREVLSILVPDGKPKNMFVDNGSKHFFTIIALV